MNEFVPHKPRQYDVVDITDNWSIKFYAKFKLVINKIDNWLNELGENVFLIFKGILFVYQFVLASYWSFFKKTDITRFRKNAILRIALFIGVLTTGVVIRIADEYKFPIWSVIFLTIQFLRILTFLGSEIPITVQPEEPDPLESEPY
jgi:hypothetical protein